MAQAQDILNRMELLNQELQLQPGEADFTRGLLAINVAQKHLESLLALHPDVMGSGVGNLTQTIMQETTPFPAGVIRIDRIQFLDPTTLLPSWDLFNIKKTGGQAVNRFWPWNIISQVSPGKPVGYYTNGAQIYWSPVPDVANNLRWYGFQVAADLTTTASAFVYPDIMLLPMASFATELFRVGVDDDNAGINAIAEQTFLPVITVMAGYNRDEASGYNYRYPHTE